MSIKPRTYKEYLENSPASKSIDDGVVDYTYNLPLVGKFVSGYSAEYAKAILWSIEHFAAPYPPTRPIVGQLWFDTSTESLKICESVSPLSYKIISTSSPESSLSSNDVLPDTTDTHNLGSEEKMWDDVFADKVFVENLYFRNEDGSYINALQVLSISSDEIMHGSDTLTTTLNNLYSSGASNTIVTLTTDSEITPVKGIMYIKTNTTNISAVVKKVTGLALGDTFSISNFGSGNLTLIAPSGVTFENITSGSVVDSVTLTLTGDNKWVVLGSSSMAGPPPVVSYGSTPIAKYKIGSITVVSTSYGFQNGEFIDESLNFGDKIYSSGDFNINTLQTTNDVSLCINSYDPNDIYYFNGTTLHVFFHHDNTTISIPAWTSNTTNNWVYNPTTTPNAYKNNIFVFTISNTTLRNKIIDCHNQVNKDITVYITGGSKNWLAPSPIP